MDRDPPLLLRHPLRASDVHQHPVLLQQPPHDEVRHPPPPVPVPLGAVVPLLRGAPLQVPVHGAPPGGRRPVSVVGGAAGGRGGPLERLQAHDEGLCGGLVPLEGDLQRILPLFFPGARRGRRVGRGAGCRPVRRGFPRVRRRGSVVVDVHRVGGVVFRRRPFSVGRRRAVLFRGRRQVRPVLLQVHVLRLHVDDGFFEQPERLAHVGRADFRVAVEFGHGLREADHRFELADRDTVRRAAAAEDVALS
mmetsp:Transcript_10386/g.20767  ORF Transcript_10386/g.20767 Transcript_10386/m.20767 type:complete len:249 (+) Transcript_10386:126-872(+)